MAGVVKLVPLPTAADAPFIHTTVLVDSAGLAVKVTGEGPHEVCAAILKVSVTGQEGVEQAAVKLPNTVAAVKVVPEARVNRVTPSGSTTVKPTSEVQEPKVPTCTVTGTPSQSMIDSV